jgi:hypothetical protein
MPMEADWAAEVGPDLPRIDIPWEGFVDLREVSSVVQVVKEAADHHALERALIMMNSEVSPVFTAKCDVWSFSGFEIDHDEFGSLAEDAHCGLASYIDVLQIDPDTLASFEFHERWVRGLTRHLRTLTLPNGRVEFIIRPASVDSYSGYGITLYAAGCGADAPAAYTAWRVVLGAAVAATMNLAPFLSTRAHTGE